MAVSSKPGASANAQTVYNALRAKGYSNAAAAGAVGNLQQESGVNPGSQQTGGAGRGIAQWGSGAGSGGRWQVENQYAASKKEDPWALNTQIGFLEQEMNQRGYGATSTFGRSTNVATATQSFETGIEQAGNVQEASRSTYAQNAYAAFSGNKVSAATGKPSWETAPLDVIGKKTPAKTAGAQNPIGAALGAAGNLAGDIGSGVATGAGDLWNGAQSAAGDVSSVPKAIGKVTTTLFSVSFWIRVAFIIVGVALVFIGTKALLTGSPPQMPALNGKAPSGAVTTKAPTAKKSFGKSIEDAMPEAVAA